jgi:chaperonin GroES
VSSRHGGLLKTKNNKQKTTIQQEEIMPLRPLQDRVIIKRTDSEEKTASGIIIPNSAKEKPLEGKIVAVGPGKKNEDGKATGIDVKKGDIVLFGKYAGTEIKVDGEELIILREDDILAVVEKK